MDNCQGRFATKTITYAVVLCIFAAVPAGLGPVLDVSVGMYTACAIKAADKTVSCWDSNVWRRHGIDVPTDLGPVLSVSAGDTHSCAVTVTNLVRY